MASILSMHIAIGLELDKTQDFEVPYMSGEQIDYWLNKAIRRTVKQRYTGNNEARSGFEQTQKRIDDLRLLVNYPNVNAVPTLLPVVLSGTTFYGTLPTDYWFLVRLDISTQKGLCPVEIQPGLQVKQETVMTTQEDPFNRSFAEYPTFYLIGTSIIFPTDGSFTITGITPYYIRTPGIVSLGSQYLIPQADVDCDLSEHIHDEIVDTAVMLILENISDSRFSSYSMMERKQE